MAMGYMRNKSVKIGYEFPEISLRADRQTHRQTCTSQYSALLLDEVVGDSLACYGRTCKTAQYLHQRRFQPCEIYTSHSLSRDPR